MSTRPAMTKICPRSGCGSGQKQASADAHGRRPSEVLCVLRLALALLTCQAKVVKRSVALLRHEVLRTVLGEGRALRQVALLPQVLPLALVGSFQGALAAVTAPLRGAEALAVHRRAAKVLCGGLHRRRRRSNHARSVAGRSDGSRVGSTVVVHVELAAWLSLLAVELVTDLLRNRPTSKVLGGEPHGFAEGDVALPQVRERPLHHQLVLLVVAQEVDPQRGLRAELLAQDLRIPADDQAVLGARERDVQTPWVVQEANALVLV
mmetsp:Transcript_65869/g.196028  ORF Transcript_65869/g.196028 Transcript_65869/m.196028 type:complete len:264 (-) Transcript_65869:156-947(-)